MFILGLGIADSDDEEEDTTDLMDDDDAIFLPEKSANARRLQPLIPDDFGLFHLLSIHFLIVFKRNCLWLKDNIFWDHLIWMRYLKPNFDKIEGSYQDWVKISPQVCKCSSSFICKLSFLKSCGIFIVLPR